MSTPGVKPKTCLESFYEGEARVTRFAKSAKARDGVVKTLAALSEAAAAISSVTKAAPDIKRGFETAHNSMKDARVVFGLMNILDSTRSYLQDQVLKIVKFAGNLRHGTPVKAENKYLKHVSKKTHNKEMVTTTSYDKPLDKVLCLISKIMEFIGTTTFAFAFGICRPIIFVGKHFEARVSQSARKVGQQFGIFMMVNHMTGFVGGLVDLIRDSRTYLRDRIKTVDSQTSENVEEAAFEEFKFKLFANVFTMIEKLFEEGISVINIFKISAPIPRIIFSVAAAGMGVYRLWDEAAYS